VKGQEKWNRHIIYVTCQHVMQAERDTVLPVLFVRLSVQCWYCCWRTIWLQYLTFLLKVYWCCWNYSLPNLAHFYWDNVEDIRDILW